MLRISHVLFAAALCGAAFADPPRCVVEGRVVDAAGSPLPGVVVQICSVGEPWSTQADAAELKRLFADGHAYQTTLADGRFTFDLPMPTASWVSLYVKGSQFHSMALPAAVSAWRAGATRNP